MEIAQHTQDLIRKEQSERHKKEQSEIKYEGYMKMFEDYTDLPVFQGESHHGEGTVLLHNPIDETNVQTLKISKRYLGIRDSYNEVGDMVSKRTGTVTVSLQTDDKPYEMYEVDASCGVLPPECTNLAKFVLYQLQQSPAEAK